MTRAALTLTVLGLLALPAAAQEAPASRAAALKQRLKQKLAEPWLRAAPWRTDYAAARAEAKASGELVLAYFTRSDAFSLPSLGLERGLLSAPAFRAFAVDVVLFCHVTSGIEGRKHEGLHRTLGGRGFPYLVFLDPAGRRLGQPAGRTVEALQAGLAAARELLALRQKADKTPAEQVELLQREARRGALTSAQVEAKRAQLRLPAAADRALKRLAAALAAGEEVAAFRRTARSRQAIQAEGPKLGRRLFERYQRNGVAPLDAGAQVQFFSLIMDYAAQRKVLPAAEAALAGLAALKQPEALLRRQRRRVATIRKALAKQRAQAKTVKG